MMAAAGMIASVVLTEGAGFLRDQAGHLLQRRRERPVVAASAARVLDGTLTVDDVDEAALARNRAKLQELWYALGPQPGGEEPNEQETRAGVEALRATLEAVLRQHITFKGEQRPQTGTPVASNRTEGSRYITVTGDRNIAIGGDNYGAINEGR